VSCAATDRKEKGEKKVISNSTYKWIHTRTLYFLSHISKCKYKNLPKATTTKNKCKEFLSFVLTSL